MTERLNEQDRAEYQERKTQFTDAFEVAFGDDQIQARPNIQGVSPDKLPDGTVCVKVRVSSHSDEHALETAALRPPLSEVPFTVLYVGAVSIQS